MLRLFLAFLLAVALPLQGIAAAACPGRTTQSSEASSNGPVRAMERRANIHGVSDLTTTKAPTHAHGECPGCIKACCHPALPAALAEVASSLAVFPESLPARESPFASWVEPVPRKPPRA